eukprot:4571286-Lingulodinium_polyedra.AAC.1
MEIATPSTSIPTPQWTRTLDTRAGPSSRSPWTSGRPSHEFTPLRRSGPPPCPRATQRRALRP